MNMRKIAGGFAVMMSLFVVVVSVPIVARWQLEKALSELFSEPAQVESVSINPFTGNLQVRRVEVGAEIQLELLDLTLDMQALFSKRLHVERVTIGSLRVPVHYRVQPAQSQSALSQNAPSQNALSQNAPSQRGQGQDLTIGGLGVPVRQAQSVVGTPPSSAWTWQVDELQLQDLSVAVQYLSQTHAVVVHHLEVTGANSEFSGPMGYDLDMAIDSAHLLALGELDLGAVTAISAQVQLAAVLADFNAYWPLELAGTLVLNQQVNARFDDVERNITLTGSTQIKQLALVGKQPLSLEQLDWAGSISSLLSAETGLRLSATGLLQADQLAAPPFGKIKQVALRDIDYRSTGVAIDHVSIEGLDGLLKITQSGAIAGLADSAEPAPEAEVAALTIHITELDLAGQVRFIDQSRSAMVTLVVPDIQLKVNDLGQGLLTRFELKARHQEEHQTGELLITGTGQLLDSPVNAELTMSLTQFELHQISPYLGYGIRSGRLGLDSSINITDNQIAAKNRVRIEGLKVDASQSKAQASADLPLSVALNLLKDKDGRIDLKVPIQTKLGKFAVDTSDIVNTALANAAKQAAFAYVKQALQPLGTLLFVKDMASAAARPRFQPVTFASGSAEIEASQQDYINKIVALMMNRPGLTITLCGVATQADKPASSVVEQQRDGDADAELAAEELAAKLQLLAVTRGKEVTRRLVDAGIAVERLFACRPQVLADDSAPRLTISL
ncbi:DUF748 domain-containing protein [Pseudomonadales bacterium]|nr:DUF748 domain-containing protein [Pseudomonadales bacterium]MDC1368050.1 DUF748 domain-containing protein [Pseudomonadales bacterium]